jgi:hypothetical protein
MLNRTTVTLKPRVAPLIVNQAAKPIFAKIRKYRRFQLDVRISVAVPGIERPFCGRTVGVNEAGISALIVMDLKEGDLVGLEFTLPDGTTPLRLQGIVRSRSAHCYGFEFLTLSGEQRREINRACAALPEQTW